MLINFVSSTANTYLNLNSLPKEAALFGVNWRDIHTFNCVNRCLTTDMSADEGDDIIPLKRTNVRERANLHISLREQATGKAKSFLVTLVTYCFLFTVYAQVFTDLALSNAG